MQKVAADLAQLLGLERVLWEQEHLVTYGFDGTATLYGEAGCVVLPQTTEEVTQVVRYAAKHRIPVARTKQTEKSRHFRHCRYARLRKSSRNNGKELLSEDTENAPDL